MKHISKLFALLLALAMIVSTFSISFAIKPNVYQAKDTEAFLMAAQKMVRESNMFQLPDEESGEDVDLTDRYQTGRIMVCPDKDLSRGFLKDTDDAIFYNGWCVFLLLSFQFIHLCQQFFNHCVLGCDDIK